MADSKDNSILNVRPLNGLLEFIGKNGNLREKMDVELEKLLYESKERSSETSTTRNAKESTEKVL